MRRALSLTFLLAFVAAAGTLAQGPASPQPGTVKVEFENQQIRVFPPRDFTAAIRRPC